MITQEKFHKLCKYSIRLQKSLISNNSNNYTKYCSHLKYHIGGQIGSGSNPELDRLFDILTKYINDNSTVYNITDIEKKFVDEKKKLNSELDETTKKLNLQIIETKSELMETKNKLEEANSNEYTIKKLEELQKIKYDEFVDLLEKLFTQVYNEEIASNIIEEIGQAETWKDNEAEKTKRIETKVNVNGKEYTWNEIIDLINFFQTDGSAQLISDIKNYLETGTGDVKKLISRYNMELSKSTQKLGLNSKPKQTQLTGNITIPSMDITGQNLDGIFRTKWGNKPIQPFQIETTKK
jgi:hypothetical protein